MPLVRWHGHACFELAYPGLTVVIDPHDGESLGLPRPRCTADLVLVTHEHFDHNAVEAVSRSDTKVLRAAAGPSSVEGLEILGIRLPHDKYGGARRGWVTAYVLRGGDGVRLAHLGDLGDMPGPEEAGALHGVDVMFVPVGGTYTLTAYEAWELVNWLEPRVVVPMHYWVPGMNLPIDPIDEFLKYVKKWRVVRLERPEFEALPDKLPGERSIYVLPPPRG